MQRRKDDNSCDDGGDTTNNNKPTKQKTKKKYDKDRFLCVADGCDKTASFGYPERKRRFCVEHKSAHMVDKNKPKCAAYVCKEALCQQWEPFEALASAHHGQPLARCSLKPSFNTEGEKKAVYCKLHKTTGMVDVLKRKCKEEGCRSRPSFNYKGYLTGDFCSKHKHEDMIDVAKEQCAEEGCSTRAYFYDPQPSSAAASNTTTANNAADDDEIITQEEDQQQMKKKKKYCAAHKKLGMIQTESVCAEPKCSTQPSFNYPGKRKRLFCAKHKKEGMSRCQKKKVTKKQKKCRIIW
mmetsp:Transcript_22565/g.34038  ORF Transcript_22565/g.34038 Transcript_22565/m.34038 type:complete len:295 (+) Transcript_22565:92-976(+)